jgi:uncharacterized membrane protein YeaQ/YmgE (transglycosylase-associated protein family)
MVLEEGGVISWLLIALPVGLFATTLVRGCGYGRAADLALGILGALLGVVAVGWLGIQGQGGWLAGVLATVAGAVLLTMLARAATGRSAA